MRRSPAWINAGQVTHTQSGSGGMIPCKSEWPPTVKATMLVDRYQYPLSGNKCAGKYTADLCPHCLIEPETLEHITCVCPLYSDLRDHFMKRLANHIFIIRSIAFGFIYLFHFLARFILLFHFFAKIILLFCYLIPPLHTPHKLH